MKLNRKHSSHNMTVRSSSVVDRWGRIEWSGGVAPKHQFEFANQSISGVENGRENCLVNLQLAHYLPSHEGLLMLAEK